MIIVTTTTREEALRRLKVTQNAKQQRIEVFKKGSARNVKPTGKPRIKAFPKDICQNIFRYFLKSVYYHT